MRHQQTLSTLTVLIALTVLSSLTVTLVMAQPTEIYGIANSGWGYAFMHLYKYSDDGDIYIRSPLVSATARVGSKFFTFWTNEVYQLREVYRPYYYYYYELNSTDAIISVYDIAGDGIVNLGNYRIYPNQKPVGWDKADYWFSYVVSSGDYIYVAGSAEYYVRISSSTRFTSSNFVMKIDTRTMSVVWSYYFIPCIGCYDYVIGPIVTSISVDVGDGYVWVAYIGNVTYYDNSYSALIHLLKIRDSDGGILFTKELVIDYEESTTEEECTYEGIIIGLGVSYVDGYVYISLADTIVKLDSNGNLVKAVKVNTCLYTIRDDGTNIYASATYNENYDLIGEVLALSKDLNVLWAKRILSPNDELIITGMDVLKGMVVVAGVDYGFSYEYDYGGSVILAAFNSSNGNTKYIKRLSDVWLVDYVDPQGMYLYDHGGTVVSCFSGRYNHDGIYIYDDCGFALCYTPDANFDILYYYGEIIETMGFLKGTILYSVTSKTVTTSPKTVSISDAEPAIYSYMLIEQYSNTELIPEQLVITFGEIPPLPPTTQTQTTPTTQTQTTPTTSRPLIALPAPALDLTTHTISLVPPLVGSPTLDTPTGVLMTGMFIALFVFLSRHLRWTVSMFVSGTVTAVASLLIFNSPVIFGLAMFIAVAGLLLDKF